METEIKGETQKEKERAVGRSGTSDRKIGRGFGGCGNVRKVHLQNPSYEEPATYAGRDIAGKTQNKKVLKKAIFHYHPDTLSKDLGQKWLLLSEEITKYLTSM